MPKLIFTSHLAQHIECPTQTVDGSSLGETLETAFQANPAVRSYVLDDHGNIRKHVAIFIDNQLVHDRSNLEIPVQQSSEIYVMQALSGG